MFMLMRGDRLVIARAAAGLVVVIVPSDQRWKEVLRLAWLVLRQEELEELQHLVRDEHVPSDHTRFGPCVPAQRRAASELRSAAGH